VIEVDEKRHHGLTDPQWIAMLETGGWEKLVGDALREVATSKAATADIRIAALTTLNLAIQNKDLPADSDYPHFMMRVMSEITRGVRVFWFRNVRARRAAERLYAARTLLTTATQFKARAATRDAMDSLLS